MKNSFEQAEKNKIRYSKVNIIPYRMKRKAGKYIKQNIRLRSTCRGHNTKHQSAFHTRRNITQNTRAHSTRRKIQHKIREHVPHSEKYNTKYQSMFHIQTNITQIPERVPHMENANKNNRAHYTCGEI